MADPYDPALLRSAPREVRHLLAAAVAEEDTARVLSTLGIGFTVWHDVRTDATGPSAGLVRGRDDRGKLDHIVLGPTGLWAMLSEDWGEPVKTKRGELIGPGLAPGERPVHELSVRARAFARAARVKFSALVVVVPDGASPEDVIDLGSVRGAPAIARAASATRESGSRRHSGCGDGRHRPVRDPNPRRECREFHLADHLRFAA